MALQISRFNSPTTKNIHFLNKGDVFISFDGNEYVFDRWMRKRFKATEVRTGAAVNVRWPSANNIQVVGFYEEPKVPSTDPRFISRGELFAVIHGANDTCELYVKDRIDHRWVYAKNQFTGRGMKLAIDMKFFKLSELPNVK